MTSQHAASTYCLPHKEDGTAYGWLHRSRERNSVIFEPCEHNGVTRELNRGSLFSVARDLVRKPREQAICRERGNMAADEKEESLREFRTSLLQDAPPAGLSFALLGLWWDGKGDWK